MNRRKPPLRPPLFASVPLQPWASHRETKAQYAAVIKLRQRFGPVFRIGRDEHLISGETYSTKQMLKLARREGQVAPPSEKSGQGPASKAMRRVTQLEMALFADFDPARDLPAFLDRRTTPPTRRLTA